MLNLHDADFTTARRVEQAINQRLGPGTARAMDAVSVEVRSPKSQADRVGFLAFLENIEVTPGEAAAKVIVNSRTGTVVIGSHVRVMPAAITHGNLTVTISEDREVSQPAPLSEGGNTEVVPRSDIEVSRDNTRMFLFDPGRHPGHHRARREPGGRGARRPGGHPRGAQAGRRAARPADHHLTSAGRPFK